MNRRCINGQWEALNLKGNKDALNTENYGELLNAGKVALRGIKWWWSALRGDVVCLSSSKLLFHLTFRH